MEGARSRSRYLCLIACVRPTDAASSSLLSAEIFCKGSQFGQV